MIVKFKIMHPLLNLPSSLCRGLAVVILTSAAFTVTTRAATPDAEGPALSAFFIWTSQLAAAQRPGACVAFRRQFLVSHTNVPATLHIFADARYLLWLNGRYVQRGPNRFEPAAPEYDSFAVTADLHPGTNTLVVLVASQISNGRVRLHAPGLTARLEQAGRLLCATDAAWKWSDQTRYRQVATDWPNIYDFMDGRVEDGDWTQPNYDDSHWANAQLIEHPTWGPLTASRIPALRETPVNPTWPTNMAWPLSLMAGDEIAFKFSHLVLAYAQIEVEAEAGSEFQLVYLPETAMGHGKAAQNRFICRAGRQSFMTTDTHSIYEGKIRVTSGRVTLLGAKFVERLYPFEQLGSFECSDPLLNRLWTTCVRGLAVTSEDAYVDCADRERVEWMDCDPPAFDVTRVAMAGPTDDGKRVYSDPRLLAELLRRTAYTLQPAGWVKAHTCSDRFDIHARMEDRACDWVQGARRYYETSGKLDVIREIWPAIVQQMNYFLDRRSPRGLVVAREWVVWGDPVGYQTCEGTALNAFVYRALADAAFLGNLLGEKAQATKFAAAADDLAQAINTVLWDEAAGTYYGGYYDLAVAQAAPDYRPLRLKVENNLIEPTRHAALFALDQGVVPTDRRTRVTGFLLRHPPTESNIMQYYYFFKQQYAADEPGQDLAVLNKMRTEWRDMAYSPFEATFEALHSWGSQAHCYGMFPAYFLSSYVLGVRLNGPVQNKSLIIEPRLADLTKAVGLVVTEFGPVSVAWRLESGQWNYAIDTSKLPPDVTVQLRLPAGGAASGSLALLDGAPLQAGTENARSQGRWLVTPLKSGSHQGCWKP